MSQVRVAKVSLNTYTYSNKSLQAIEENELRKSTGLMPWTNVEMGHFIRDRTGDSWR